MSNDTFVHAMRGGMVLSLPEDLDDGKIELCKNEILHALTGTHKDGVVIDFSLVHIIDTHELTELFMMIRMIRMLGARSVAVGMQAGVVSTIVDMGIETNDITAFRTLEEGFQFLEMNRQ